MTRIIVAALLAGLTAAAAHEWYPKACCNGNAISGDCRQLDYSEVMALPNGWKIDGQWVILRGQERNSVDDHFHGCFPNGELGCFFAPKPSS